MDSKVLSQEQIKELVRFIHSRGFKEPIVVLEILDHFACKVEELLALSPHQSFEQVMIRAHDSFGVKGFQPIVKSFEEQTEKKYRSLFWKNFKLIVSRPVWIIVLPVISLAYFKFFIWTVENHHAHVFDGNDAITVFFLTLVISQIGLWLSVTKTERRHPFAIASITSGNFTGFAGLLFYTMGFREVPDTRYAYILGLLFTIYFVYWIPRFFAARKTIKKAQEDIEAIDRMTIEV